MSDKLLDDLDALASGERIDLSVVKEARNEIKRLTEDSKSLESIISKLERQLDGPHGLRAEVKKLRSERDALRQIILDAAHDAEWWDKEIHLVDSDESYQNWRIVVYLPVPCNVADKEIKSALDRAVANVRLQLTSS